MTHESDSINLELRGLEVNEWHYRLNAAGTPLAKYFNGAGVPVAFPQLEPGDSLIFDYHDDDGDTLASIVVNDYEEMSALYTAARLNLIGIGTRGGWRIVNGPEDPFME